MYQCEDDCPDYPGGCPWPGLRTPAHCTHPANVDHDDDE